MLCKPAFWMGKKIRAEQTCWSLLRSIKLSSGGLFYPEEGGRKFLRSTCKYIHTRRRYIRRSGKLTMCELCKLWVVLCVWCLVVLQQRPSETERAGSGCGQSS